MSRTDQVKTDQAEPAAEKPPGLTADRHEKRLGIIARAAARNEPVGRSIMTSYAVRFANIITVFLLFPLVSGAVGTTAYGVYLLTASVATMFQMDLGMANATVRYVASAKARGDAIELKRVIASSTVFFLALAGAVVVVTALVFTLGWNSFTIAPQYREAALILVILVIVQAAVGTSVSVQRQILTGLGRLDLSNSVQIAQVVFRYLSTMLVIVLGGDIVTVGIVDTVGVLLSSIAVWMLRRIIFPNANVRLRDASWPMFKSMLRLSIDVLILGTAALLILQSGNLIVSLVLPVAAVAVFGAGYKVFQLCRELTNSLTGALLPLATRLHVSGLAEKNRQIYLVGTKYANAVVLIVTIPVLVFTHSLMTAWLGPELATGTVVAQVLVLSFLANNNHLVAVPILTGQGRVRGYAILHMIWAACAIGGGFLLTELIGVAGMALAIAVPIILMEPVYIGIALRRLNITWRTFFAKTLGPSFGLLLPTGLLCYLAATIIPGESFTETVLVSLAWCILAATAFGVWGTSQDERSAARAFVQKLTSRRRPA